MPKSIRKAIAEVLRCEGPTPVWSRCVTTDVTLRGVTVPERSVALVRATSVDRDERALDDSDGCDVLRLAQLHTAFCFGVHVCLVPCWPASTERSMP